MYTLVRKTLELYLREKRIITQSDLPSEAIPALASKEAVFVTLYQAGRVIASSGRIQCLKENTVYECIDNTLICLKDPRCADLLARSDILDQIQIRVDLLSPTGRRMIQSISDLDMRTEGVILLSQNLGTMAVILPHMIHLDATPEKYLDLVCQKAGLDRLKLTPSDYVLYAIKTVESTDMV
jgi:MEMO1 family protein